MVFDHTVKYNGEYYPAGMNVPMEEVDAKPKPPILEDDEEVVVKKRPGRPPKNKE